MGFRGVECLFPYAYDMAVLKQRLEAHNLRLVLFDLPAGDWEAGERRIGCDPARIAEFEAGLDLAIAYAVTLDCRRLNCLSGIAPPGVDQATLTRHEPGTGEVDFDALFSQIDRLGYQGWVGCEYVPRGQTEEGLSWAREYLR